MILFGLDHHLARACIICHASLSPSDATAGLRYADGTQAFAHSAHFRDSRKVILGWTDFIAEQRQELAQRSVRTSYFRDTDDEWALY